jgi:S1-C subfamily serine protease
VLALGNPLGLGQTVTAGIISAKGRSTGLSDGSFEDFLQTDAAINQGNSGGGLVNTASELIGINSQILSPSGGNIGIGFAIPSNMAKSVMTQLVSGGKVHRGQLGIGIQTVTSDLAASLGLNNIRGVLVNSVKPGSPADRAGIKQGDVIVALNGKPVNDTNSFRNEIAGSQPGTKVNLTVLRNGKEQNLTATLGEFSVDVKRGDQGSAPDSGGGGGGGQLGLSVEPLTADAIAALGLRSGTQGLLVRDVDPVGPAAEAGIQPGDVIVEVNRQPVRSTADIRAALRASGSRPALVLINRNGQTVFLTVHPRQ